MADHEPGPDPVFAPDHYLEMGFGSQERGLFTSLPMWCSASLGPVIGLLGDRIGRKLTCECQILNDDKAIRRRKLESVFGVDFGETGKRWLDVL